MSKQAWHAEVSKMIRAYQASAKTSMRSLNICHLSTTWEGDHLTKVKLLRQFRRSHSGNSQPSRDTRYRTDRWLDPEIVEQGIAQRGALLTKNAMGSSKQRGWLAASRDGLRTPLDRLLISSERKIELLPYRNQGVS
jgi:hypothetical protein